MKPVLVGESNPVDGDPRYALWPRPPGCAGARLAALLNLTAREYLAAFDRVNLMPEGRWPAVAWRESAAALTVRYPAVPIIMLGGVVARAFGRSSQALWTMDGRFVRVPHPSGRCREWHDPASASRLRDLVLPLIGASPDQVRLDAE